MKRMLIILILIITTILAITIRAQEDSTEFTLNKLKSFGIDIQNFEITELEPEECIDYGEYSKRDFEEQEQDGLWSTIWQRNLTFFDITSKSSSTLKGYDVRNIVDKKPSTAWVEGVKGNGIGEWVNLKLVAEKESPTTTPFSIHWVAIIPGYEKSNKTWEENNRLKSALLIIHSPNAPRFEYVVCRLKLKDFMGLQVFRLPNDLAAPNMDPMIKNLWLVIEDVYKGKKYSDTCISEIVIRGGCLP